ncbi:hypothetical protein BIV25_06480 [Streptomyces sp. MUSC 14]|nr:hypothetical protein BIV25_06480 [Streptomyces sp. MUSC 14]
MTAAGEPADGSGAARPVRGPDRTTDGQAEAEECESGAQALVTWVLIRTNSRMSPYARGVRPLAMPRANGRRAAGLPQAVTAGHANETASVWWDWGACGSDSATAAKWTTVLISRTGASRPTPRRRSWSRSSSPEERLPTAPQHQSEDETTPETIQG